MLLLKVVADERHLNLDVAKRAREVLPQLTIFCSVRKGAMPIWWWRWWLVPASVCRREAVVVASLYLHCYR